MNCSPYRGSSRGWVGIPLIACVLFCFSQISTAQSQQPSESDAWAKIKPFSIPDLRAFAAAFPNSERLSGIKDTISVLTTLDEIRAGKTKPKCTIPFAALGHWDDGTSVWDNWRQVSPDREAAGWFIGKDTAGIFNPIAGAGHSISIGNSGRPRWPSGDGSVWGIESENLVWLSPGLKISTHGKVLLGVVYNRGLVCLSGTGTLVFHDEGDREVIIK